MKGITGRLLLLLISGLGMGLGNAADVSEVATESGIFAGSKSQHQGLVTVFKGIGYAAPPVRDLRWKPPVAAIPFAGVRQADRTGPACWQGQNSDATLYARGNLERSEDCLYLNVFTGAADSRDALPVMVWFHGGSNTAGHAGPLIFDGANLAARGAVIVTANYRLGALGFLAHPGLTAESEQHSSGNYGLLDQLAVLRWVRNNIAGFGGDPGRVTIFGQSAGGADVCLLMSSPLADGLMHGVIGQSPSECITLDTELDQGHVMGEAFAGRLGVAETGSAAVAKLRALDPETVISTPGVGGTPLIDGWVIPERPYDLLATGRQNRIPVMVGGLADEYHGLSHSAPEISEPQLDEYLRTSFGNAAERIKANYTAALAESPLDARKRIATDNSFLLASRMWGRLVSERGDQAYVYYFSRPAPVFRLYVHERPDLYNDGGQRRFGAYHSGELAYVFDNLGLVGIGWDAADRALSETMADYWVSFARNGNPNADGLPNWPVYNPDEDLVQVLDTRVYSAVHPRHDQLDDLEQLYLQSR
ncbi:MAG: carboxylesterase family protein [Gammaproteobacteria bacterium]|nr:carboxylesterase/lipase family protein [Pseudomonadales bacterium]